MPITDLVLRGISRAVSDINTPDGGTAELINAVVENNEIRPISPPTPLNITLPGDLLAIQVVEGGEKVFISAWSQGGTSQNTTYITFTDEDGVEIVTHTIVGRYSGLKATVMDNVVVVSAAFGMYYFLYRDGGYEALGQRPPFPKLMFTLKSNGLRMSPMKEITMDEKELESGVISGNGLRQLYNETSARIEKFLAGERKNGHFVFPFFVRYALRLFDGSGHFLHSAPILMNPSSYSVPFSVPCKLLDGTSLSGKKWWEMGFRGTSAKLQYHSMMSDEDIADLAKWKDLVTHVDIFVSAPIYSNKEITADYVPSWDELDDGYGLSESQYRRQIETADYGYYSGQEGEEKAVIKSTLYPEAEDTPPEWEMVIPAYTKEEQEGVVKSTSQFYLLSSIPIEELSTLDASSWEDVAIEEGTLDALVNRPVLKDDFNSHVLKNSNVMEVYNDRLILAGMGYTPYGGYPLSTMRSYINRELYDDPVQSATTLRKGKDIITVQSEREYLSNVNKPQISWWPQGFYYYPDASAKEITIPTMFDDNADTIRGYKTYELTPHNSLNGAYLFLGYPEWNPDRPQGLPISGNDLPAPSWLVTSYSAPSEVYQSVVGNPFVFPLEGITSIGKAPLIALTASTIEVSSGQFGDFPMYAFAEDGVWALGIDQEGWISAPQLISNDVCLGESMVAALNRPVVFGSKRGLMLIEGSKVSCLSDNLLGPRSEAPDLAKIDETECFNTLDSAYSHESFIDFMSKPNAALAYDYAHNRIYITHPGAYYCYVLSLQSLEFSKMTLDNFIIGVVPHYSGVYLATKGWGVNADVRGVSKISNDVDTDGSDTKAEVVVVVTRPIKFGTVSLKTIKHLLTRHNCEKGVGVLLYGSRDEGGYGGYQLITSLRGRSYKYFVLVLYAPEMTPQERISCVSFDWEQRFSNKFR